VGVLSDTLPEADLATASARAEKFTPVKIDEAANGIFRNVPWAKVNTEKARQTTQVRRAQQLLTEIGFDIGGADGSIGPRTKAAIISFERSNSLPETGRVNTDLIDRLELASGA
jgi:localization factor PodJL